MIPDVFVADEGQTTSSVRSEGVARRGKVVEFDLGWVENGEEECKFGSHAEEELAMPRTWIARVMEERTENVPTCCRSFAHPRKPV